MAAIEGIALSKSFGGVVALRSASFAADGGEVRPDAMDEAGLGQQFERGLQTLLDGVAIRIAGAR